MYCNECGTKMKTEELFCGNCGAQKKEQESTGQTVLPTNNDSKPRKPMSNQKKIIIAVVAVVLIGLIFAYNQLSTLTAPKKVATDYVDAVTTKDAKKMYSYLNIGDDKTFVSKDVFVKLSENNKEEVEFSELKATNVEYNTTKTLAKVTFTYSLMDSTDEDTMTISLIKEKSKKWLFFDNWKISPEQIENIVVEDYKINTPTGSKVTYAGIEVDKKYINKDESSSEKDVYVLKQVFGTKTDIKVELPSGHVLKENVTPSSYSNKYTAKISLSTLGERKQVEISNIVKADLKVIYENAISKKEFAEVKSLLNSNSDDLTKLETSYNKLVSELESSTNTLTAIEFTNVELNSLTMNDNGSFKFRVKADYDYTVTYTSYSSTELQTKESDDYSYIYLTYNSKDNKYNLVEVDSLTSYFSRY